MVATEIPFIMSRQRCLSLIMWDIKVHRFQTWYLYRSSRCSWEVYVLYYGTAVSTIVHFGIAPRFILGPCLVFSNQWTVLILHFGENSVLYNTQIKMCLAIIALSPDCHKNWTLVAMIFFQRICWFLLLLNIICLQTFTSMGWFYKEFHDTS